MLETILSLPLILLLLVGCTVSTVGGVSSPIVSPLLILTIIAIPKLRKISFPFFIIVIITGSIIFLSSYHASSKEIVVINAIIYAVLAGISTGAVMVFRPLNKDEYKGFLFRPFAIGFFIGYISLGILYLIVLLYPGSKDFQENISLLVFLYSCGGWLIPATGAGMTKIIMQDYLDDWLKGW